MHLMSEKYGIFKPKLNRTYNMQCPPTLLPQNKRKKTLLHQRFNFYVVLSVANSSSSQRRIYSIHDSSTQHKGKKLLTKLIIWVVKYLERFSSLNEDLNLHLAIYLSIYCLMQPEPTWKQLLSTPVLSEYAR